MLQSRFIRGLRMHCMRNNIAVLGEILPISGFCTAPLSRKSRGLASSSALEIATIPRHVFIQHATIFFDKIWKSLEELAPLNRQGGLAFRLQRESDFIRVEVDDVRVFYWQRLDEDFRILYSSPISTAFYEYSTDLTSWNSIGVGKYDSHNAIGMFVRDHIRECIGIPALEEVNTIKHTTD